MAATGFTPIQLYRTSTASAQPTAGNLSDGELAINLVDEKLYFKNSSGTVKLLASSAGASGSVTTVSVASANGFGGTVANATTTPAITLTTSVTGLLKGNGTGVSAAVSGTDYAPATSGTSILYGNGSGGFSNVTIGSGISFAGGTLSATGSGGTVTSVAQSFTGGLISVSGSPITGSGTLALTVAGTSGGVPYFSSASTWASSGALTANAIMIGGGAGAAPSTTSTAAGILTFLGTPSSANLAAAVTDETGSGSLVFGTSPTLSNTTNNGSFTEQVYTLTGTALSPANGTIQTKTLSAITTFTDSLSAGQSMVLMLEGGSTYAVTWPTMTWVTATGNAAPTLTAKGAFVFWKISTTLYGAYVGSYV